MDWLNSSNEERKILYVVIKSLMSELNITLYDVFEKVLEKPLALGTDYESNFRSGKVCRKKANQIHKWLRSSYPNFAVGLEVKLLSLQFPHLEADNALALREFISPLPVPGRQTIWEKFVAEHAKHGTVAVQAFKQDFPEIEKPQKCLQN